MERLDKLLAGTGRWSRKQAGDLVRSGRVRVNGAPVSRPDLPCPPEAEIAVDGELLSLGPVILMLNKPAGVLSATRDPDQPTVLDLLPAELRRAGVFPVGRLDKDTEGLLLLTNDGDLAHSLLSPRKHVPKTYLVRLAAPPAPEDADAFATGIPLKDGTVCRPARLDPGSSPVEVRLTIQEGKYHQVKRMFASRGNRVVALKRLSMGPLDLDPALDSGQWRPLTAEETGRLRRETGG